MIKSKNTSDYRNCRWFYTSSGKLVVGGKNENQNELVLKNFLKPNYIIVHTSAPGSPFMIIQSNNPSENDIKEAAIFCACFSKQWKLAKNKKNQKISVHVFKGYQIYKTKEMKIGTFGVKGKIKKLAVKPELVLAIQDRKLRAVPKNNMTGVIEIIPGKLSKEQAVNKISKILKNKLGFSISREEIEQAIPSGNISIKEI